LDETAGKKYHRQFVLGIPGNNKVSAWKIFAVR